MRNLSAFPPIVGVLSGLFLCTCTSPQSPHTTAPSPAADPYALTQTIDAPAPQDVNGNPGDPNQIYSWYFSPDRAVRMHAQPLHVGRNKVGWFRPDGADIQVTGRRLDAPAPPMEVDIGSKMPNQFCPSILVFPTAGRWEIVAKSGKSELRAVVDVSS